MICKNCDGHGVTLGAWSMEPCSACGGSGEWPKIAEDKNVPGCLAVSAAIALCVFGVAVWTGGDYLLGLLP